MPKTQLKSGWGDTSRDSLMESAANLFNARHGGVESALMWQLDLTRMMQGLQPESSKTAALTLQTEPISSLYEPDALVRTTAVAGNTFYLGGDFHLLVRQDSAWAAVDNNTGAEVPGAPTVHGLVVTSAPDGAGGWYIGGNFDQVGGQPRANLAHILSDMSVATWNPQVVADSQLVNPSASPLETGSPVTGLIYDGGVVYVNGAFTSINGQTRHYLAAIDGATGALTSWNPDPDGVVTRVAVVDTTVYVGGAFVTIGGQSRNGLAAIGATTGAATNWNPDGSALDLYPVDLAVDGGAVFAAGLGLANGDAKIIAINTATDQAIWSVNADSTVLDVEVKDGVVYAAGQFSSIGGTSRGGIAALDAATGNVTSWDPNPVSLASTPLIYKIELDGNLVYVAGLIKEIGGAARPFMAAVDASTGLATPWQPTLVGYVFTIMPSGSSVGIGGTVGQTDIRFGIAAIDNVTGLPTSFAPLLNGSVLDIAVVDNTVYVCGNFTETAADTASAATPDSRLGLAAFNARTGALLPWDPSAEGGIPYTLHPALGAILAGGTFTSIGGQPRGRIAALDAVTGVPYAWNPGFSGPVNSINDDGDSTIYVGGNFVKANGLEHPGIAAIDAYTAEAKAWNPTSDGPVYDIEIAGSLIYVGGYFSTIGGLARSNIAQLQKASNWATDWNPNANDTVFDIELGNRVVYVGGAFTNIGGATRSFLAAFDLGSDQANDWDVPTNNIVTSLTSNATTVWAGGAFTTVSGQPIKYITATLPQPAPAPTGEIIQPVAVYSTSEWGGGATDGRVENLINGSGLSGVGPVELQTHDNDPNAATMWHAGDVDGGLGGPTGNPPVVDGQGVRFDLESPMVVTGAYIWNHNQSGATSRGVASLDVYLWDGSNWIYGGSYSLNEAGGGAESAQLISLYSIRTRSILFYIRSAQSGLTNDYVGLSEVRFLGYSESVTAVDDGGGSPAPAKVVLRQNEPNPFNPVTTIHFDLPKATTVSLRVYDLAGRLVRVLVNGPMTAGYDKQVKWDGTDDRGAHVASGVYLYRLDAGEVTATRKMVLLK